MNHVKYLTTLMLAWMVGGMSSCAWAQTGPLEQVQAGPVTLIPKPMQMERADGVFVLNSRTVILVSEGANEIRQVGSYLLDRLRPATGMQLALKSSRAALPPENTILLTTRMADQTLAAEGYDLIVQPHAILLRAPHAAGLFYGVQTIRQLLPEKIESQSKAAGIAWTIPCVKISDKPRFLWRGFMLDSGRHFQTKEFVKRYIDLLAYYKLNQFHWHLTEDKAWRIEIKKYPKLVEVGAWPGPANQGYGGYYTQDDIREVVAYAKSRYITVTPEVDIPGHTTAALVAYPEYSCTGGPFEVGSSGESYFTEKQGRLAFCAGNNKTYDFLKDILGEVMDVFDSPVIHIGGDERPGGHWDNCPKCQARIKKLGLKSESHLQNWFMEQINDFIVARHRRSMAWAENMEDGIPAHQIVQGWHVGETEYAVQQMGFPVVNSEHSHCYLDYPAFEAQRPGHADWMPVLTIDRMYDFDPVPADFTPEQADLILGAEAPLWTGRVPQDRVDFKVFPRLLATIDIAWSPVKGRSFEEFRGRVKRHLRRMEIMGIQYDRDLPSLR